MVNEGSARIGSRRTRLAAIAVVVAMGLALLVGPVAASATGRARAAAVPPTPVLVVTLRQGVNADPSLTPAQLAEVRNDVKWLQGRLDLILPQIRSGGAQWSGGVLPVDGVFSAQTTAAVKFFQAWANASRALLHEAPLFRSVDGVVTTTTADIIAFVGGYFQNHPAPGTPDQVDALAALNQDRFAHGLPLLGSNAQLMKVAQAWSAHLASTLTLAHNLNLRGQVTGCYRLLSENVGFGHSVDGVEQSFILDAGVVPPVHRNNIENRKFDEVGVGVTVRDGVYVVVQDFMESC